MAESFGPSYRTIRERSRSRCHFFPPPGASMSRRAMWRKGLFLDSARGRRPGLGPACLDGLRRRVLRRLRIGFPRALAEFHSPFGTSHPLAGHATHDPNEWRPESPNAWRMVLGYDSTVGVGDEDEDGSTEPLTAWRSLYDCGLVGFPLSSRLPQLFDLVFDQADRLIALVVRLRLERLGARLAGRAACLAALLLLAMILSAGPRPDPVGHEPEPPILCLPRAPGVDPFRLYVPRC